MPNLTHQAETATLGALLNNPQLLDDVPYLTASHFADPRHQVLFAAIADTRTNYPDATVPRLYVLIARAAHLPGITPIYLSKLAETSPDPTHAAVYGRMVQEASLRRTLAGHAERLARDTATLIAIRGTYQDPPDPALSHLARLASALRQHTRGAGAALQADSAATAEAATARDGPADPLTQREEQILAGLLQSPGQVGQVLGWLPPGAFTPGIRREIYQALQAVAAHGEPVTELTVAWELGSQQTLAQLDPHYRGRSHDDPAYLSSLSANPTAAAAAITAGRALLADYLRSGISASHLSPGSRQPATPAHGREQAQIRPAPSPGARPQPNGTSDDRPLLLQPPPGPGVTANGHQPRP